MPRDDLLVWMDLEMTSIRDATVDRITELAIVLTDKDLNIVAECPSIYIHTDKAFYESRNWMHEEETPLQRALIEAVDASDLTMEQAEAQAIDFLKEYVEPNTSPLCGNSIHADRHFLKLQMPRLEKYMFYRCIDVSSLKELARRWAPQVYEDAKVRKGKSSHRALDDIKASIEELRFYRTALFKL